MSCTWRDGAWWTREHTPNCDTDCDGCRPCGDHHCAMRGRCPNHVTPNAGIRTCPSCIGKVRAHIREIVTAHTNELRDEAEAAGINSEAFTLTGPAADNDQYDTRRGCCSWPKADADHHPFTLLGYWDLRLRDQYGPETSLLVTVARAGEYLEGLLAGPFPHGDEFEDFAADLRACLTHIGAVLHDSDQGDRANIGCFDCGGQLERRVTKQGMDDRMTCRDCGRRYTSNEYGLAVRAKIEDELAKESA